MPVDPRWRAKMEALERAGLRHLLKDRIDSALAEWQSADAAPLEPPTEFENNVAASNVGAEQRVDKAGELIALAAEVSQCHRCEGLCHTRTQTVFSDGSPNAELCFVGEAPGADEDAVGVPFVGRAGQLLTRIIEACKLRRDEAYICNVLKCRPPGNRNPLPDEVENCRPFLDRQIQLVRPRMMVALGKYAAAYLLNQRPEDTPITKIRGQIRDYCGIPFMITLHPAYLLRNPAAKKDVWEDMKTVMRILGRPVDV